MLSRTQIQLQLRELKNFKLVSYFGIVGQGKHRCTLIIEEFRKNGLSPATYIREFTVTEEVGFLSAVSVDAKIVITKLS